MKIDNSRIFTADVYQVINSWADETVIMGDVAFGSYDYKDMPVDKGVVVIYFKNRNCYVPLWYLRRVSDYASIRFGSGYRDERILLDDPGFMPPNGRRFVKNVKKLFENPGRTSVEDIIKKQAELNFSQELQSLEISENNNLIEKQ